MYNSDSRTKNTAKNIFFSIAGQLIKELLAFLVRTVFIRTLSVEYLGVNGLFTNILSILSLAEMGVGSALVFSMYKPMAEHDEKKLQMYMAVYKRVYTSIGLFVLGLGIVLTPFLSYFMKERPDIPNLELIYILYVLNTGATYFFAYKGSIFNADQRNFIVTNNTALFTVIQSFVRIVILLVTRNFIAYLFFSILVVYIQNFVISKKADRAYPFIKEKCKEKLPKEEAKKLKKDIFALMLHKIGAVILSSSDNIILSKFVGILSVGLYSNYSMLIIAVKSTLEMILNGLSTSVGNLCAKESKEKSYQVFNIVLMVNIWIVAFCAICLYLLLEPFISIWLGDSYLLSDSAVIAIVISFYVQVTMRTCEMFRMGYGLFWRDRYAPVIQCLVNIIVSIALTQVYGITGIFVGTSIALLTTKWWITPFVLFKYGFGTPFIKYFLKYFTFTGIGICAFLVTQFFVGIIHGVGILGFVIRLLICAIIPNVVFCILGFKTKEFQYCWNLCMQRMQKNKHIV